MSIKICVLSDGVRVIGDFYEVASTFKKVVGYAIVHPQIISMTRTVPSTIGKQTNESQFNVQFSPWNPFAKNQFFKLNMDRVVSVNDPREDIKQIYDLQDDATVDSVGINIYSDATLTIYNNQSQPAFVVKFKDVFPYYLSPLEFNAQMPEAEVLTCQVAFKYSIYTIEPGSGGCC